MKRTSLISLAAIAALAAGWFSLQTAGRVSQRERAETVPGDSGAGTSESSESLPDAARDRRSSSRPAASNGASVSSFQKQAQQIATMPADTPRENAIRELAQAWTREHPGDAERWAAALKDADERERALTQVALEVAARDPKEAIRIAQQQSLHEGMVDSIASRWATADFPAAMAWAADLPSGDLRGRVTQRLIQSRANEDPAEAAAALGQADLTGAAGEDAALTVLHRWALKDPEAARQWVDGFPEGTAKEKATAEIQAMTADRVMQSGN